MAEEKKGAALDAMAKAGLFRSFLDSQNAKEIEVIDIKNRGSIADAMLVATATSRRHAHGLADGIHRICGQEGIELLGMEGYEGADWILIDCNDTLVNIFQEEARDLYKLEDLWSGKLRQKKEDKRQ